MASITWCVLGKEVSNFYMQLKFKCYPLLLDFYNCYMFYVSLMVTIKKILTEVYTQKMRKKSSHFTINGDNKRAKETKILQDQKLTKNYLQNLSLSIITLNVNRLNYLFKR